MVVVGMRPSRRIYLTCRNADGAQSRHCEGRFLAAASRCRLHRSHRRRCAGVGGTVCYVFMTPVVHLQHSFLHSASAHTLRQFVVVFRAEVVEVFVVNAHRQDEMAPFAIGNLRAPGHLRTSTDGNAGVFEEVFSRLVEDVCPVHIGIQELQRLAFFLGFCHVECLFGIACAYKDVAVFKVTPDLRS